MRNHYRARGEAGPEYAHLLPSLNEWASQDHRLLMVSGRKNAKSPRHFAIDVIEEVQGSPVPVIWALSKSRLHGTESTLTDVLRMLTVQALQIPRSVTEEFLISPAEIESTADHKGWMKLLRRALRGLKQVYIVIDTDILRDGAGRKDQHVAVGLMNALLQESRGDGLDLKIVLVARKFAEDADSFDEEAPQVLQLHSDAPERTGDRHRSRVNHTSKGRASRPATGRGRTKRSSGLAGQLSIRGPALQIAP